MTAPLSAGLSQFPQHPPGDRSELQLQGDSLPAYSAATVGRCLRVLEHRSLFLLRSPS